MRARLSVILALLAALGLLRRWFFAPRPIFRPSFAADAQSGGGCYDQFRLEPVLPPPRGRG